MAIESLSTLLVLMLSVSSTVNCAPPRSPVPPAVPSSPPTAAPPSPSPGRYAIVAFQWPMGLCKTSICNQGKSLPSDHFTLHGVWPTDAGGSQISNCKGKDDFSYTKLKYQWNKHGTCSELDFSDYFERSLALAKKCTHKLYQALAQNGIRPSPITDMKSSHTPLVKAYYDATYASLNLIPKIKCISTPDGKMYLLEIHLCASFDLMNFKNCSVMESSFNYDNCGSFQQISSMVTKAIYYHDPKKVVV
ncbi:Ribonuclease 3 [Bienertia sinuspersici]